NTLPRDKSLRINSFLQTWKNLERKVCSKRQMPSFLRLLVSTAKEWGLRTEGLAFERKILREMPMWFHQHANEQQMKRLASNNKVTKCVKSNHNLRTVGDFEEMAAKKSEPTHQDRRNCDCETCEEMRTETGCENPNACFTRAEEFLNSLPSKWDPRGEHPEDYENTTQGEDDKHWKYFDR
ncbi:hypothetical protein HDZ31DRAFT_79032, partial [Schizophyllum fasciatum]